MKSRRPYTRHGLHALKRRVMMAGTDAIDRRSAGGKELRRWIEHQVAHLGGHDEITHPERTLVQRAAVLEVLIRQCEGDLLARGVLIGRRRQRRLHPLLPEFRSLIREQREILTLLGLKRHAITLSLADVIEQVKTTTNGEEPASSETHQGPDLSSQEDRSPSEPSV